MFQIETALLPLLGGGSAQDGSKMSVVKRRAILFFPEGGHRPEKKFF